MTWMKSEGKIKVDSNLAGAGQKDVILIMSVTDDKNASSSYNVVIDFYKNVTRVTQKTEKKKDDTKKNITKTFTITKSPELKFLFFTVFMKPNTSKYFYTLPKVEKNTKYSFADNLDRQFRFEPYTNRFMVDTSK